MISQVSVHLFTCMYMYCVITWWINLLATVLLFFKFYDAVRKVITYVGHSIETLNKKFGRCFPGTEHGVVSSLSLLLNRGPVSNVAGMGVSSTKHPPQNI